MYIIELFLYKSSRNYFCLVGMSQRLCNNADILKYLSKCNCRFRKHILKKAPKDLVYSICELVHNILQGKVPLNKEQFNKLKRHRSTLKRLASKKGGRKLKEKREILVQRGGFLPLILGPLVGIASSLISSLIERK